MSAEILINVRPHETRVAYVEGGVLTDLKIEFKTSPTLVGSIFRGRVIRVLPGMQAAFVDIGLEKAAFLYGGDIREDFEDLVRDPDRSLGLPSMGSLESIGRAEHTPGSPLGFDGDEGDLSLSEVSTGSGPIPSSSSVMGSSPGGAASLERVPIQNLVNTGQFILVQVAKDPIGNKGARLTTHISLPGRFVVYLPSINHLGISRKITSEKERERLRDVVQKINPLGGVIIRTAGEGASTQDFRSDIEYLDRIGREIFKSYEKKKSIGLIHAEPEVELRFLRDMMSTDVSAVWVDDPEIYKKVSKFVSQLMPHFKQNVVLYENRRPLFDLYDIDMEISRSLDRKVWLKSGGSIVIDEAEALVAIDVNTGRFVGKKDLEETILKTNLEAVREIAHQLRIRNCGGIIIIDFIDMEKEAHREKVLKSLAEELEKDRARTQIISMSPLGLVEMTRKRIRPSLLKTLCEPCSYCEGQGYLKRRSTIANEIFRELERNLDSAERRNSNIVVHCHNSVMDWIYEAESDSLAFTEARLGRSLSFQAEPSYHLEQYEIFLV